MSTGLKTLAIMVALYLILWLIYLWRKEKAYKHFTIFRYRRECGLGIMVCSNTNETWLDIWYFNILLEWIWMKD